MRINAWFLLPALVLVTAAVGAWQRSRVPSRADWQAAVARVRAGWQPGDGATWAPYTQGEGRTAFGDLKMLHVRELGTADLARFDRLWLLGTLGYDADDLGPEHTLVERSTEGEVTVDLVRVGGPKVVGDLYADLEQAVHTRHDARGGVKTCDFWSGRGWHCDLRDPPEKTRACLGQSIARRLEQKARDPECGLNPWLHASRDVRLVGDTPRHCIWLHPMAETAVRLTWNQAPGGDALVIDFGFADPMVADNYAKQIRVKPAKLRVLRAGLELASLDVPATKGWHRHALDLPAGAAPLAFEVTTSATADAHFCFDPTVRVQTRPGSAP
jgi:hypothetical protein